MIGMNGKGAELQVQYPTAFPQQFQSLLRRQVALLVDFFVASLDIVGERYSPLVERSPA
jgi:hypothetical protein